MGLFDKLESKLEQGVNGAFARAFRAEVQPVEIASAMRRAMDDRASSVKKGKRPVVPNLFTIELSQSDYSRLCQWGRDLDDELIAAAQEHADEQRYLPGGPLTIVLAEHRELETGVFHLRPATAGAAEARAEADAHPRPQPKPSETSARGDSANATFSSVSSSGSSSGSSVATANSTSSTNSPNSTGSAGSWGSRIKGYLLGSSAAGAAGAAAASASAPSHDAPVDATRIATDGHAWGGAQSAENQATAPASDDAWPQRRDWRTEARYDETGDDGPGYSNANDNGYTDNNYDEPTRYGDAPSAGYRADDRYADNHFDDDQFADDRFADDRFTADDYARDYVDNEADFQNTGHYGNDNAPRSGAGNGRPAGGSLGSAFSSAASNAAPAPVASRTPGRSSSGYPAGFTPSKHHAWDDDDDDLYDPTGFHEPDPTGYSEPDHTARFDAPAQAAPRKMSPRERPWLKIDGQRYPLLGAITVLGRDDDADIVIDDPGVSRRHSEIRITHDGPHLVMSIRDLGSTNGTFVNGEQIESEHIRDNDALTLGRTRMTIHLGDRL